MSCETVVCRTCLATDIKMLDLANTKLQDIFEKLTESKLGAIGGRWICYICCSQLQRCQRFFGMARRAELVLRRLQAKGIQLIPDSVTALRPTNSFLTTPVACMSLPDLEGVVRVKIEPMDIKEEVLEDSELCKVDKIEDPTEDLMKMCKDYINDDKTFDPTWTPQIETNKKDFETNKKQFETNKKHLETNKKQVETNKKQFACKDCGIPFISVDALKAHLDNHKYICNYCNYECKDKLVFQRHLRKHTKPFHCNFCEKSFSEQSSLRKHITSHSSKKPYVCDQCDKGFSHRTYLRAHLRTHTDDKPFKCDVCSKQFGQTGHLIVHKRSHFPKIRQKHKCLLCGKCFTEKNCLNKHMKTHTDQISYSCEFCFKTFAAQDMLKSHLRCHTGEKPFQCNVCERMFRTSGYLVKHMKSHGAEELLAETK